MKNQPNKNNSTNMKQGNSTNMKMFDENNGGGVLVEDSDKEVLKGIDVGRWYSIRECEKIFGDMRSSVWLRRVITMDSSFFQSRKKISLKNKKVWRILGSDVVEYYIHLLDKESKRMERISGGGKYPYIRPSLYVGKKMRSEILVDDELDEDEKLFLLKVVGKYELRWEKEYIERKELKAKNKAKKTKKSS